MTATVTNTATTIAERHPKAFFWKFALAYIGTCLVWAGPSQLLLANQMLAVRPGSHEGALALLMMLSLIHI